MRVLNKKLLTIVLVNFLFLLYGISTLSISFDEAKIFFENKSVLSFISHILTYFFGNNDYALRLPFILIHFINIFLLVKVSTHFVRYKEDSLYVVILYILLPGINSASLILNEANLVICITLTFIYFFINSYRYSYLFVLIMALFVDNAFLSLFLAVCFYAFKNEDKQLFYISLLLSCASFYIFGTGTSGKPHTYFIETFTLYGAVFSPFLFFYFIYTIFRILVKDTKLQNIVFFIAITSFSISILLSFRQKIYIENFAPFLIVALPLVVKGFLKSYRVRLKMFRKHLRFILLLCMSFLFFIFYATYFNSIFYYFLDNPKKHFAYKQHFTKELALYLENKNIKQLNIQDNKLALQLKFYGIENNNSSNYSLLDKNSENSKLIEFKKFQKVLKQYHLKSNF